MLQRTILLAFMLTAIPMAQAQDAEKKEVKEELETRIVRVQHIPADSAAHLFMGGAMRVMPSNALGALSLTGTKEQLDKAEAQIRLLDVARHEPEPELTKNVEIMVHYLGADVGAQAIPADSRLNAVVEQLRRSFAYKRYSLLASYMVRASVSPDDRVEAMGILPTLGYEPVNEAGEPVVTSRYELGFSLVQLRGEAPNRVALLRRLFASWQFPVSQLSKIAYERAERKTGVDLPEGKLVVLGKAGLPGQDKGIFLVLEARPAE